MTDLVKKASVKLGFELVRSLREGGGTPVEADSCLNDASRDVIQAMKEKHGTIYLGRFNPVGYDPSHPDSAALLYRQSLFPVLNFEADFVVPVYDHKLVRMLMDRLTPRGTPWSCSRDSVAIGLIQDRIRELGGELLSWS